jgi:Flp pilus assembly protein TadG
MTRDQRGAATAELALAIPLLLSLTVGLVWLLTVGAAQVRMVDAAREAARAAARGDPVGEAESRGEQVAPPGSTVSVVSRGDRVVSTATGSVRPPGGLLGFLPRVRLRAEAVAAAEETP